ncbi:MAG: methyltransferase domain-containing protein, partial [Burkholderiales bacterium]
AALLRMGWSGIGFELDSDSAAAARRRNDAAINERRYSVENRDWLSAEALPTSESADLIISCMVLEHLDESDESLYLQRCRERLVPGGHGVLLVPGSPRDWGIEDEIAGHQRRYTRERLVQVLEQHGSRVGHIAGLTFPLSNWLLPLSNHLVSRAERHKMALDPNARTRASGRREVAGKTAFPPIAGVLLNEIAMYPAHLVQKWFRNTSRALVLYVEFSWPQ